MTDDTRCSVCGGPFSSKRVWIEGAQMHEHCSLMSQGAVHILTDQEIKEIHDNARKTAWQEIRDAYRAATGEDFDA